MGLRKALAQAVGVPERRVLEQRSAEERLFHRSLRGGGARQRRGVRLPSAAFGGQRAHRHHSAEENVPCVRNETARGLARSMTWRNVDSAGGAFEVGEFEVFAFAEGGFDFGDVHLGFDGKVGVDGVVSFGAVFLE